MIQGKMQLRRIMELLLRLLRVKWAHSVDSSLATPWYWGT